MDDIPFPLILKNVVFHFIDQKRAGPVCSEVEILLDRLSPVIQTFLLEMVAAIWNAPDASSTRSARFAAGSADSRNCVQEMLQGQLPFLVGSRRLAELLFDRSHPSASPGLLGVMRLERPEDSKPFVALVKVRYRDEELVRLSAEGTPLLDVAQVDNVLCKDIQKGAIIPHPDKADYDVKVIDGQSRDDPAAYFTEKFLGCVSKKSDDLQVRKLVPALERYAADREMTVAAEKLPLVLQRLQDQPEAITAPVLAEAASKAGLFSEAVEPEEIIEYLGEIRLGDLDIPKEQFERKRKTGRKVIYRFVAPELDGLEISGPPEAFARILSSEGDEVVFLVKTSSNGFRFGYQ